VSVAPLEVTRQVRLSDGPLEYTLRRSRRARHLRVTVHPARGVVVTIPMRGGGRAVDEFLREREGWLLRHVKAQERQRERAAARRLFGPDGSILFRGEPHHVRIEPAEHGRLRSRVVLVGGESPDPHELIVVMATRDRRAPVRVLEDWLREQASSAITEEIALHASALGVTPAAVSLRDPKTRWGSATRTCRLSFSWRLILAPPRALESVVVHELAHLRVFGHAPAFWAVVASRVPDHRVWRKWLHDHSLELHSALDGADEADDADDAATEIPLGQLSFADQLAI
jgi:predicted metal-dependent hydrolase